MRKPLFSVFITLNIIFFFAQSANSVEPLPQQSITDKQIIFLSSVARDHLSEARLSDGSNVPQETPSEKTKPIFTQSDLRKIVEHGVLADMMQVCGLNWEKDFSSFMNEQVMKEKLTPKQRAYMGLVHGISMGYFEKIIQTSGCTPAYKAYFKIAQ